MAAVRETVGVEIIAVDLAGTERLIKAYPNVGLGQVPLAMAPDGTLLAVGLQDDLSSIITMQGQEQMVVRGQFWGWWPG
jgi:hypothetical protein